MNRRLLIFFACLALGTWALLAAAFLLDGWPPGLALLISLGIMAGSGLFAAVTIAGLKWATKEDA